MKKLFILISICIMVGNLFGQDVEGDNVYVRYNIFLRDSIIAGSYSGFLSDTNDVNSRIKTFRDTLTFNASDTVTYALRAVNADTARISDTSLYVVGLEKDSTYVTLRAGSGADTVKIDATGIQFRGTAHNITTNGELYMTDLGGSGFYIDGSAGIYNAGVEKLTVDANQIKITTALNNFVGLTKTWWADTWGRITAKSIKTDTLILGSEAPITEAVNITDILIPELAIGTGNDSLAVGADGAIHQYYNATQVFKTDVSGYQYGKMPFSHVYRQTDLTISATQNIWYKITGFTTKYSEGFTVAGDSVHITKAGYYQITYTITMSGLNNEVWEFATFKNGAIEVPRQQRYTSTTDVGNGTAPTTFYCDGDDWISYRIRNTIDSDDPTIKYFSAVLTPIYLIP